MLIFLTFPNLKLKLSGSSIRVSFCQQCSSAMYACVACLVTCPSSGPLRGRIWESMFYVLLSFLLRYATWLLKLVPSELAF